ncbi:hypothetical protein M3Y96_00521500 [Aphelenchoides besseyi]|nr:hypothetical protein M3Y96_00521500 [Aphelenchoides besseyi]
MFCFFGLLILLVLFVGVDSYGNNECIRKHTLSGPGFNFINCTDPAEVVMQWKKEHIVPLFKLIVNDECELEFEGKEGDDSYAKWTNEDDDKTVSCSSAMECDLQINKDGKLMTYIRGVKDQEVDCEHVRKELDESSVWSKFRVENLPVDYKFQVFVKTEEPKEDEGKEFVPLSTTTSKSTASGASAMPIEIGDVVYVLVAISIVILLSASSVFLSSTFAVCK